MQRRDFILRTALAVTAWSIAGCTTTATTTTTPGMTDSDKRRHEIDTAASATLERLETVVQGRANSSPRPAAYWCSRQ